MNARIWGCVSLGYNTLGNIDTAHGGCIRALCDLNDQPLRHSSSGDFVTCLRRVGRSSVELWVSRSSGQMKKSLGATSNTPKPPFNRNHTSGGIGPFNTFGSLGGLQAFAAMLANGRNAKVNWRPL